MSGESLFAQSRRPTSVREREANAKKAELQYLTTLAGLAEGYEQSGDLEKATETLRQILKVSPDNEKVKDKIKELDNKVFEDNQHEIKIDSSKGWTSTGIKVTKGEPIRLIAAGSYKFIVNSSIGPDGFSTEDVQRDMGAGVNCGALMGLIVSPPKPGTRGQNKGPGKPFTVGSEMELKPDSDGILFLKLNVPPGSKCIGTVDVKAAGNIAPAGR